MASNQTSTTDNANNRSQFRPALFVGLGSTGAKIVSKIKKVVARDGEGHAKNFHRYLNIVTDVTAEPGVDQGIDSIVLTGNNLSSRAVINSFWEAMGGTNAEEAKASFANWWYPDPSSKDGPYKPWIPPVANLERGAGGVRALGRLLLHYHCRRTPAGIVQRIKAIPESIRRQREALDAAERQEIAEKLQECYVFGLLAGGTCSGTFLDVAYLLKSAIPEAEVSGIFLLGDICYDGAATGEVDPLRRTVQRNNSLHALAEMIVLQNQVGRNIAGGEYVRRIGNDLLTPNALDTDPYRSITLVGARNDHGHKLPGFSDYQDFIAEYFGQLYSTDLHTKEVGRSIDDEAGQVLELESSNPSRPHKFRRIGMMVVRTPRKKIMALLRNEIANFIAVETFKNAPQQIAEAAIQRFQNDIELGAISNRFTPADDGVLPDEDEPLAPNKDDFRRLWEDRLADIESHYSKWDRLDSTESLAVLNQFRSVCDTAERRLLDAFVGTGSDNVFNLGGLKYALGSLTSMLDDMVRKFESNQQACQQQLYSTIGVNLKKQVANELAQAVSDFPTGLFAALKRGSFGGDEAVEDALRAYRDTLQTFVNAKLCAQALNELVERLRSLEVARQLVSGQAGVEPFLLDQRKELAEEFSSRPAGAIDVELITEQQDVQRVFATPMLEQQASAVDPRRQREIATELVLTGWKSRQGVPFADAFNGLLSLIRQKRTNSPANALQDDEIAEFTESLQAGFASSFNAAMDGVFNPALDELSVWQAVERYVRSRGKDHERILRDLFKSYYEYADFFGRLSDDSANDSYEFRPKVFYLCNQEDAATCFRSLGIPNHDTHLATLLTHVMGSAPTPLPDARKRDRIVLLLGREGELPYFYSGFRSVRGMVRNPPVERSGGKGWSDKRFTEWIHRWHEEAPSGYKPQIPS